MRFLTDQDVYRVTLELLRQLHHDVLTAAELRMSRASDEELLREALRRGCLFLTRDKDFGALVFLGAELRVA
jgi:predicted nuclease of predicted toxin-antitoxin system